MIYQHCVSQLIRISTSGILGYKLFLSFPCEILSNLIYQLGRTGMNLRTRVDFPLAKEPKVEHQTSPIVLLISTRKAMSGALLSVFTNF